MRTYIYGEAENRDKLISKCVDSLNTAKGLHIQYDYAEIVETIIIIHIHLFDGPHKGRALFVKLSDTGLLKAIKSNLSGDFLHHIVLDDLSEERKIGLCKFIIQNIGDDIKDKI